MSLPKLTKIAAASVVMAWITAAALLVAVLLPTMNIAVGKRIVLSLTAIFVTIGASSTVLRYAAKCGYCGHPIFTYFRSSERQSGYVYLWARNAITALAASTVECPRCHRGSGQRQP